MIKILAYTSIDNNHSNNRLYSWTEKYLLTHQQHGYDCSIDVSPFTQRAEDVFLSNTENPLVLRFGEKVWLKRIDDKDTFVPHRENNLPSFVCHRHDSFEESYRVNGKLHRTNGHAYIRHGLGIVEHQERYYIDGVLYSKPEYFKQIKRNIIFDPTCVDVIRKLLYIPEIFQNVYYEHKGDFISLIRKM